MAQPKSLTQAQVDLLRWISDGCPDGLYEGDRHRISAAALRNRGLVTTKGHGPTWTASITGDGRQFLEKVSGPQPPQLREPNASVTQQLVDDVVAAGGSKRFPQRRYMSYNRLPGDGPDYEQRARQAHAHRRVPPGQWLEVARVNDDEIEVQLRQVPDGWPPITGPVPVPATLRSPHQVVTELQAEPRRHEWSSAQINRVLRLLQALVAEATRRGFVATTVPTQDTGHHYRSWTGSKHGHVQLTSQHVIAEIRIFEGGYPGRSYSDIPERELRRETYLYQPSRPPSRAELEANATGKLSIEFMGPRYGVGVRPTRWTDSKRSSLEDLLPEVLCELGIREIEADEARIRAELAAAQRQRDWEAAMTVARTRLAHSRRAEHLEAQLGRWHHAADIRAYADAIQKASCGDDPETDEWVAWIRAHADSIDPTEGDPPLGPSITDAASPSDLAPFLDGWSPYGPDQQAVRFVR